MTDIKNIKVGQVWRQKDANDYLVVALNQYRTRDSNRHDSTWSTVYNASQVALRTHCFEFCHLVYDPGDP
jgi:hypothetical protein